MFNLLKANLRCLWKNKLFLISIIVMLGIGTLNIILYLLMDQLMDDGGIFAFSVSGKLLYLNSFSISNNGGLIIPVFIIILLSREFSNGTIRNKVIAGHSKVKIYLSFLITALIYGFILLFVYALFDLIFGCLFFGYGTTFNGAEFGSLLKITGLAILNFGFVITMCFAFLMLFKNIGLSIVCSIGAVLFLSMLSILSSISGNFWLYISYANPAYQNSDIISGANMSGAFLITTIITLIIYITLCVVFGSLIFKKKDLK